MKIRIVTTGYAEIGPEHIIEEEIQQAIDRNDKWLLADITDAWRSDVDTDDTVTIVGDDGRVLWQVTI